MISTFLVEERIRQLRKQCNLSQDELAHMAGISSNYLGQIERGEKCPSVETFLRLASALNISPVSLIKDCECMPSIVYTPELNRIIHLLKSYSVTELNEIYNMLSCINKLKHNA